MQTAAGAMKQAATAAGISPSEYSSLQSLGYKWCYSCRDWLLIAEEFGVDASRRDGLNSRCFDCRSVRVAGPSRRVRRAKALQGLYWCRGCRDWVAAKRAGLCRIHQNELDRAVYVANRDEIKARVYARKRNVGYIPPSFTSNERAMTGGLCAYACGRMARTNDHITPVTKGGISAPWNLAPACVSCNSSKNNADPEPWILRGWFSSLSLYWDDKTVHRVVELGDWR